MGGVAKNFEEIKEEFGVKSLVPLNLTGNYRSTQRIIDYYLNFRNDEIQVTSFTDFANEDGLITFSNQEYHESNIPEVIANLINLHIKNGVPEHEICVLAPQWWMITKLGRNLVTLLPNVKFDAPGLSPFPFTQRRDNIWFKIARLFLTELEPNMYLTRLRWAGDIVYELEQIMGREIAEEYRTPRKILRLRNSIHSVKADGIPYLEEVFQKFLNQLGIDLAAHPSLAETNNTFFERTKSRLKDKEYNVPCDVESLKRMFRRPNGVVVNSCHGIKGEEYETVICCGLLEGHIPHWNVIMGKNGNADYEARKMLYVIASRAKKNLHLIAECGRRTRNGNDYKTTLQLKNVQFQYDSL